MNTKDGYALKSAIDAGFRICIISGGSNEGVRSRLNKLGVTDIYLGAHNKIEQFEELIDMYDLDPEKVVYMGDDVPDYPVMEKVALPTCPADAVPEIKAVSKYVSYFKGGEGQRDVIEQVRKYKTNGKVNFTPSTINLLLSIGTQSPIS